MNPSGRPENLRHNSPDRGLRHGTCIATAPSTGLSSDSALRQRLLQTDRNQVRNARPSDSQWSRTLQSDERTGRATHQPMERMAVVIAIWGLEENLALNVAAGGTCTLIIDLTHVIHRIAVPSRRFPIVSTPSSARLQRTLKLYRESNRAGPFQPTKASSVYPRSP